jgi:polyisoprenoid-binding protein YceI
MKKISLCLLLISWIPIFAKTYKLDPELSNISFSVSYLEVFSIEGRFEKAKGTLRTDKNGEITRIKTKIDTNSLSVGADKTRDFVLGSALLDSKKYKSIDFKSMRIIRDDTGYKMTGILDLHGVASKLSLPLNPKSMKISSEEYISVSHTMTINREKFHILYSDTGENGVPLIGSDIFLDVNLVFKK